MAANIQKIPLKAKRMGDKVALSGNFNIFRATLRVFILLNRGKKGAIWQNKYILTEEESHAKACYFC